MHSPVSKNDYIALIEQFLIRRISPLDFSEAFNTLFYRKQEDGFDVIFPTLDKLFADVECYDPKCLPGEETAFRISEQELYHCAQVALDKLKG